MFLGQHHKNYFISTVVNVCVCEEGGEQGNLVCVCACEGRGEKKI